MSSDQAPEATATTPSERPALDPFPLAKQPGDAIDPDGATPARLNSPERPAPRDLEAVYDIPVLVSAVLGRATMQVSQLLKLGRGAIVELDRRVGDPIDIFVNNRLIARGEIVMIDETRLGVTMNEIVKSDRSV